MYEAILRTLKAGALSIAVSLFALCAPACVHATTLVRMSLEQMAQAADMIVRAKCISTANRWDASAIWTFAEMNVIESLRGPAPASLVVRSPGGRVGRAQVGGR
jgi:hypothetical protein